MKNKTQAVQKQDTAGEEIIVAVDDGFAATDVVIMNGGQVVHQLAIPSRARPGLHNISAIGGAQDAIAPAYETEGSTFTVGDLSDSESARFEDYPFSGMNRVIVHHALRLAGLGGKRVRLATGLPLATFYQNGVPNTAVIQRKDASIRQAVMAADKSPVAEIVHHETYPEGLSAWVDYAVKEDGNLRTGIEDETCCVIDIGGKTTDIAVVLPGQRIDHSRSGSADIGVLDVIAAMSADLQNEHKVAFSLAAIDNALRTKTIKIWGQQKDAGPVIERAVKSVLDRLLREINRKLGAGVDIDKILLVGGGANVFGKAVSNHPNIEIPDNPEFANARGFAKYLEMAL